MKKQISNFLLGGLAGGQAGTGTLGGLASAGLLTGAVSPWAWGLIGGGAALGGISSLLSEDENDLSPEERRNMQLSNQLGEIKVADFKEDLKRKRGLERSRKGMAGTLGKMFTGAKLVSTGMASERLA